MKQPDLVPSTRPGRASRLTAVGAVLLAAISIMRGSERTGDLASILLVAVAWTMLGVLWLVMTLVAVETGRWSWRPSLLLVRLAIPALFVVVSLVVFSEAALHARFAASQNALDRAADQVDAGVPVAAGWIGLYPVDDIEQAEGHGVRVMITGGMRIVRGPGPDDYYRSYVPLGGRWFVEYDTVEAD